MTQSNISEFLVTEFCISAWENRVIQLHILILEASHMENGCGRYTLFALDIK